MKKGWWITVGTLILVVTFAALAFGGTPVKLVVNGQEIKSDMSPQLMNGRVLVPVRWVAEALGAQVEWEVASRTVRITTVDSGAGGGDEVKGINSDKVDIRGTITAVKAQGQNGVLATLMIDGELEKDTSYDRASVSVTGESLIYIREGQGRRQVTPDYLKIGQRVEVKFVGPVAKSYPVQVGAGEIVILNQGTTFSSLARGDSYTAGLENPTLFIAGSLAETNRFSEWLEENVSSRLREVDFDAYWVAAVFSGMTGSSGYGVAVQEVNQVAGQVQLTVDLTEPAPDEMFLTVIAYPYHIVLIPREKVAVAPQTVWAVYTAGGTLLTQTKS